MQVKLEKTIPIPASAAAAWELMQDVPALAECMPGAQITEKLDATHYQGLINVRIGPITAAFKGKIEVKGIDPGRRELRLLGTGSDTAGASTASMDLIASVRETGDGGCELVGVSNVSVTGKIASFGGRMMNQMSNQVLDQFAVNFRNRVIGSGSGQARELNAVSLLFRGLWAWIKGLFRRNGGLG